MPLPDLTALKTELNISSSTNDAELTNKLAAAVGLVEKIVGPLTVASVTETHYGLTGGPLVLKKVPAIALTAVSGWSGLTYTELVLSDYVLDPETGIIRTPAGRIPYGDFQITYTVGRADIPPEIREAILIVASHLWETQRGVSPSALALQDPGAVETFTPGLGYAVPNRARELLAPYALGPVLA